jgi:hypothetical protein
MKDQNKTIIEPVEHRMEGELKVCDPDKTDHTRTMESWRLMKIMAEITEGFEFLKKYKLAATIYGSSRMTSDDPSYQAAEKLAGSLARSGFTVITGGAGGIMEAANKGAYEAKGESVGLNIRLPREQAANKFLTAEKDFSYFFTRRVMLAFASEVYVYFPGGYGTLNEFFEIVTLVQTQKIKRIPIVLYGREFWQPILDLLEKRLYQQNQFIDKADLDLYRLVDSVDEAYEAILKLVKC